MIKSKKYQTQQKSLKERDNQKIFKKYSLLIHSVKTQLRELPNTRKKDVEYVI